MKLKEGQVYENVISHTVYFLYKTDDKDNWYLHPSPEDRKRGYLDGMPCSDKEMIKLLNDSGFQRLISRELI